MNSLKCVIVTILTVLFFQSFAQPVSVTLQNNTSCGTPNGTASATVNGTAAGYRFKWFEGTSTGGVLLSTNRNVSGLGPGVYTVEATRNSSGQVVGTTLFQIVDNISLPVVTVEVLSHQTSCITPNGSLRASVDDTPSKYTFVWHAGDPSGPIVSTTRTANDLAPGTYTVVVTHKTLFCQRTMTVPVNDETVTPSGTIELISAQTSCITPKGALRATPSGAPSAFTYQWYRGTAAAGPLLGTTRTIKNLSADIYTVKITSKATQCSVAISAVVPDVTVVADATVQVVSASSCVGPNGSAQVILQGSYSDFTYAWYQGVSPSGSVLSTTQELLNVSAGVYIVVIQHVFSACQKVITCTIADETVIPVVTLVTTSNTVCTVPKNGAVTALVNGSLSDYSIEWFEGVDTSGSPLASTGATLANVGAGIYTARVTNIYSGCMTIVSATVSDVTMVPVITLSVTNVTSCEPGLGEIQVIDPQPEVNYTYQWLAGTEVNTGPILSSSSTLQAFAGIYTVEVTNITTGCIATASATIADESPTVVVIVNTTPQTSCEVPNGSAACSVPGEPASNFTYQWYGGTAPGTGPILSVSNTLNNVAAGFYTVVVTSKATGCVGIVSTQVSQDCNSSAAAREEAEPTVEFYPNPTHDYLRVATVANRGSITLINKDGKTIGRYSGVTEMTFDLSGEPDGVYILKYTSGKITKRYRVMKIR